MTISVAVIIPTFNRLETLPRALESVYAQTRVPDEVCVVDDGSIDATEDFIRQHYPQVSYLKQDNAGVSAARNSGIASTSSSWLAFLDSDDEWLPGKLQAQLSALESAPEYRLVHCDEIWIRRGVRVNPMNKHQKSGGEIFAKCLPLCAISPSAVLIQRSLLAEIGGFDEDFPACEDYDLWLRICATYPVLYVDQLLLKKYGGHEDQLSAKYWGMDRFRVLALDKILQAGRLSSAQRELALAMLLQKCEILRAGAKKRGNAELLEQVTKLLQKYAAVEYDE